MREGGGGLLNFLVLKSCTVGEKIECLCGFYLLACVSDYSQELCTCGAARRQHQFSVLPAFFY